jgi:hypothetical protein
MEKKWKEFVIPNSGKPTWSGGAYVLAFVYSNKGNFILKGYCEEVHEKLKSMTDLKWFANFTLWNCRQHRSIWYFWKKGVGIFTPQGVDEYQKRRNWEFRRYAELGQRSNGPVLKFKRLPKRWVQEMEKL